jgi:cellulose synthase/poly-beta-1,6-N-acetylglucosamine synthase-like glycosyltransferase
MEALNTQDYPLDRIHVILADDRSNDNTAEVANTHAGSLRLNVVRISTVPDGMSPKKHALHTAILAAKTDILLFTDADCRPEHGWISGMLRVFASGADAVVAPAPLDHGGSFASRYAAYESCRTGAYMTAASAFNLPYMASGRSWGYRKALYERCDGLPGIGGWLGGDDDLLLQQFVSHGARIASCTEAGTMVRSDAPPDLPRLYRQKLRHYSVSVAYRGKAALLLGIFTGAQVLVLPIAALISILYLFEGNFFYAFLPAAGVLWMLHYNAGFMMPILRRLGLKLSRPAVAGLECFHVVFSALVGLTSFVKPHRW